MKMAFLTLVILGATLQVQAAYKDVYESHATSVEGAASCLYAVTQGTMRDGDPEEVIIYVNSDFESRVNGSIRLTPDMLPLQEGRLIDRDGLVVFYENGILTQVETEVNEGIIVNDYHVVQVEVSPDLSDVKAAYVKKATKAIIREKVLGEMTCRFN